MVKYKIKLIPRSGSFGTKRKTYYKNKLVDIIDIMGFNKDFYKFRLFKKKGKIKIYKPIRKRPLFKNKKLYLAHTKKGYKY